MKWIFVSLFCGILFAVGISHVGPDFKGKDCARKRGFGADYEILLVSRVDSGVYRISTVKRERFLGEDMYIDMQNHRFLPIEKFDLLHRKIKCPEQIGMVVW